MSDEEINKLYNLCIYKGNNGEYEALRKLLDLYNKEKEKNKKLEIELMEQELFIDGLKEDRRIAVEEIQEQYYVSKDKIREKIKELENKEYILSSRDSEIQILQELLEE